MAMFSRCPSFVFACLLVLAPFSFSLPLAEISATEGSVNVQEDDPEGIVCPRFVSREEWGANPPKEVKNVSLPVNFVVIHHTYSPPACWTPQDCQKAVKSIQRFHQEDRGWFDIGYNFAIGGDARAYIGRGWGREGAHAPPYNQDSVGITLIGDWRESLPTEAMLATTKLLIQCGVKLGYISPNYKLLGHMQARTKTECPGKALFNEIKTWPQWSNQWINQPPTQTPDTRQNEAYLTTSSIDIESSTSKLIETNYDLTPQVIRVRRQRSSRRNA